MNFEFLKSNRFWGLIIIAVAKVLEAEMILDSIIVQPLIALVLGFIAIRTVDRLGEKIGKK